MVETLALAEALDPMPVRIALDFALGQLALARAGAAAGWRPFRARDNRLDHRRGGMPMRMVRGLAIGAVALGLTASIGAMRPVAAANAEAKRCGWFENPTPANMSLKDRAGEWEISAQGGYQAGGVDLPDMSTAGWVTTNPPDYGYGCACVTATWNNASKRAIRISSVRPVPLAQCRADRTLPKP